MEVYGGRPRLEGCDIWGNVECGVKVKGEGDPTLAGCTIRDHAAGGYRSYSGCGVYVHPTATGRATVGADCVFERNAAGGVVREPLEEPRIDFGFGFV